MGLAALQTFSKCLNFPLPFLTQNSFDDELFSKHSEAIRTVAVESIKQAAAEVIEEQDENHDTMVSVDGLRQHRGQ